MAKAKVEKHGDKTKIAIEIMEANVGKGYEEVSQMIADAIGVDLNRAKVYYRHKVINGIAKGYDPNVRPWEARGGKVKASKTAKTKDVPAKKLLKEVGLIKGNRFTGNVKTTAPKTEDEVSRIKAANLARMKEITARNKVIRTQYNGNIARGADDPFDPEDFTPESARAELEAADVLDSFSAPRFLSKDAVKALV